MRPIYWLHISDIHARACNAWSQDVVLKAMCQSIKRQRMEGVAADFILATGDLAFSGKAEEYAMVGDFFDALRGASGVAKERIFCVGGNHDIDRDRQKLCFQGARAFLQNQSQIDGLLGGGEDLLTLLKRQENYRQFQNSYLSGQNRTWTEEGLGYVSRLMIEEVRLAIVGLDSAWLAEGGLQDHGSLLIGERQVINAIRLAQECDDPPHIILGMAHHPLHLLREFDRQPTQDRIERACRFFHCGHLHAPEARTTGHSGADCLTLGAGASFETRQLHNNYSLVRLDLLGAARTIYTIQYNPGKGEFSATDAHEYRIEVTPTNICGVGELAQAMTTFHGALVPWAHYLSALLLDQKAELLVPAPKGYAFGSFDVLRGLPNTELKHKTSDFMAFRNALRALYKRTPLSDIFVGYGAMVRQYGEALKQLCNAQPDLKVRLDAMEKDAQILAKTEPRVSFSHTGALLNELASAQDWDLLCEHAQRSADSPDPAVAIQAKRMLALALAHSSEASNRDAAIGLYRMLAKNGSGEVTDIGNLAILCMESGHIDEAKAAVLNGIREFAQKVDYFSGIGQKIIEATGDASFRKQIEAAITERDKT